MPSTVTGSKWFLRVDYPREHVEEKLKTLKQWIDLKSCLAVFHTGKSGENPHFHAIIELQKELQKQSFDVRVKTLFNVKGTQYSSKQYKDGSGGESYLFHENTSDILVNKGYSDKDIEEYKRLNAEVQKVVEINKERGTSKSIQRIIDDLPESPTEYQIFKKIMLEISEGRMYHPGFRMTAVIKEIYIKKNKNNLSDIIEQEWLKIQDKL